ncbi:hypothetical protein [Nocardia brasiliensis]|uniref:hypothetical protein n=1 Tax=Nocardia brasiliensis TaxID=37326 RepID=UPI002453AF74|nr:hypothetical protein [Nocardia brasiliensis]
MGPTPELSTYSVSWHASIAATSPADAAEIARLLLLDPHRPVTVHVTGPDLRPTAVDVTANDDTPPALPTAPLRTGEPSAPRRITGYRKAVIEHALANDIAPAEIAAALGITKQAISHLINHSRTQAAYALPMDPPARDEYGQQLGGDARWYVLTPETHWAATQITHVIVFTTRAGADTPATTAIYACDITGRRRTPEPILNTPLLADTEHDHALRAAGYLRVQTLPPPNRLGRNRSRTRLANTRH